MSEHEPLPDELAELFAAERAAPVADIAVRAAARSRLTAAIAGIPLGKAAAAGALSVAGKTIAVLAVTVAAGAATVELLTSDQPASATKPPAVAVAPEREAMPTPRAVREVAPKPIEIAPPALSENAASAIKKERVSRAASEPLAAPPSQTHMLRRAWALVSAGQSAEALALARDDQRLHPDGVLSEEREALIVQALSKLHRTDDARAAAIGFIARFPNSVHRAQVERALEEVP